MSDHDAILKRAEQMSISRIPHLIAELLRLAYRRGVFNPGGCSAMMRRIENGEGLASDKDNRLVEIIEEMGQTLADVQAERDELANLITETIELLKRVESEGDE